jgi:hypothetical protein
MKTIPRLHGIDLTHWAGPVNVGQVGKRVDEQLDKRPTVGPGRNVKLTEDEARRLLGKLTGETTTRRPWRWQPAYDGARSTAWRGADVELDSQPSTITIRRSWQGDPKIEPSATTLPISDDAAAIPKAAAQGARAVPQRAASDARDHAAARGVAARSILSAARDALDRAAAATAASSTAAPCPALSTPCATWCSPHPLTATTRPIVSPGARAAASCTPPSDPVQNQNDRVLHITGSDPASRTWTLRAATTVPILKGRLIRPTGGARASHQLDWLPR